MALAPVLRFQMRGGVQAEDLRLDLVVSCGYPWPLDELIRDPELAEASICHCGLPQRAESVPHINVVRPEVAQQRCPSTWAHSRGRFVTVAANVDPTSL